MWAVERGVSRHFAGLARFRSQILPGAPGAKFTASQLVNHRKMRTSPLRLARVLEPYKTVMGVLVGDKRLSLAVSNPYLQVADPCGDILLRADRFPTRALTRLMKRQEMVGGLVIGHEAKACGPTRMGMSTFAAIQAVSIMALPKGLLIAEWDKWDPETEPVSYRAEECPEDEKQHRGTRFLQHYLDYIGTLNTFG